MFATIIYRKEAYIREIDLINWFQSLQIAVIKKENDYIDGIKLLALMTDHIKSLEPIL